MPGSLGTRGRDKGNGFLRFYLFSHVGRCLDGVEKVSGKQDSSVVEGKAHVVTNIEMLDINVVWDGNVDFCVFPWLIGEINA